MSSRSSERSGDLLHGGGSLCEPYRPEPALWRAPGLRRHRLTGSHVKGGCDELRITFFPVFPLIRCAGRAGRAGGVPVAWAGLSTPAAFVAATAGVRKRGRSKPPLLTGCQKPAREVRMPTRAGSGGVARPARADHCEEPTTQAGWRVQAHPRHDSHDCHTGKYLGKWDPMAMSIWENLSGIILVKEGGTGQLFTCRFLSGREDFLMMWRKSISDPYSDRRDRYAFSGIQGRGTGR